MGGWTLDVQHVYEPITATLLRGDGTRAPGSAFGRTVSTFAGIVGMFGSGGTTAATANFYDPTGVSVMADGSVLIADTGHCTIRKVAPNSTVTTVAGTGACSYNGESGAATSVALNSPSDVVAAPDGSFYISDTNNQRIRKVDTLGNMTTVAGSGGGGGSAAGHTGDGGPGTSAQLNQPIGIFLTADGSLYIADSYNNAIRKLDPAGYISTVAGTLPPASPGYVDGVFATVAKLDNPLGVAVSPEGVLYISDHVNNRIRRVGVDGIIHTIAGTGSAAFSGDNDPALDAALSAPANMALARDGTLYFADHDNLRIRAILTNGTIVTIAGNGTMGSINGSAFDAEFNPASYGYTASFSWGIALSGDQQTLYITDGSNDVVRQLELSGVPGLIPGTATAVASTDGSDLYEFDQNGRHTSTISLPSNITTTTFGYDSAGYVTTITDAYGNVTAITRDSSENPLSISNRYGVTTTLTIGTDGYLAQLVEPTGAEYEMSYLNGALSSITFPTGVATSAASTKTYDTLGRIATSTDAAGHKWTYTRTIDATDQLSVTKSTLLGVTETFAYATTPNGVSTTLNTRPDTSTVTEVRQPDGNTVVTTSGGMTTSTTYGPDSRFGLQAPIPTSTTISTPGVVGIAPSQSRTTQLSRTVTLSDPSNPLSAVVTETDSRTVNGQMWTSTYTASTKTVTTTSPTGRVTTAVVNAFNSNGAPTQVTISNTPTTPNTPISTTLNYEATTGRLTSTVLTSTDGTRTWATHYHTTETDPTYGSADRLTDPMEYTTSIVTDLDGRPTSISFPDGTPTGHRSLSTTYDGDGDLLTLTLPSSAEHQMTYTPVDALMSYVPPNLSAGAGMDGGTDAGASTLSTGYAYDEDGRILTETRPDGNTITYGYDNTKGRLQTVTTPTNLITLGYDATTGHLTSAIRTPLGSGDAGASSETLSWTYNGALPLTTTWSGSVAGTVGVGYEDHTLRVTSQTVNGSSVSFGYDNDDLLTSVGSSETISRDVGNGRITGTTFGTNVTDAYTYDAYGMFKSYTANYGTTVIYSETIDSRDNDGRITQKTETVSTSGTPTVWNYIYDSAGRLTDVKKNGTWISDYTYDANDNRQTYTNEITTAVTTASYDAQDRLQSYGSTNYTYGANGELQSKTDTDTGGTTNYTYDVSGNLLSATLADGTGISYTIDPQNRRIATSVTSGSGTINGLLYQNQLTPVAQLDGSGNVIGRFVFGSKANVPDYVVQPTRTLRVFSDHLGSPRMIIDTSDGTVVEQIDYDEFGQVVADSAPGTIPFGFAGGRYDARTGLVRFGARDYDPSIGRWVQKDANRFAGGLGAYEYCYGNPIGKIDLDGHRPDDPTMWDRYLGHEMSPEAKDEAAAIVAVGAAATALAVVAPEAESALFSAVSSTAAPAAAVGGVCAIGAAAEPEIEATEIPAWQILKAMNQMDGHGTSRALSNFFEANSAGGSIQMTEGVTVDSLLVYRAVAQEAIYNGKDTLGEQALRRDLIDRVLGGQ